MSLQRCCNCALNNNRCQTHECPCYVDSRFCDTFCESEPYSGDCLNKPITRCNCKPSKPTTLAGHTKRKSKDQPPHKQPSHHSGTGTGVSAAAAAAAQLGDDRPPSCTSALCECRRYGEACSKTCACFPCQHNTRTPQQRQRELQTGAPPTVDEGGQPQLHSPTHHPPTQIDRPVKGCKCSAGKKGCAKSDKCVCRQALQHCELTCKCVRECANSSGRAGPLSKQARQCFLDPDDLTAHALVCTMAGQNNYKYRIEFTSHEKHSPQHAVEALCDALMAMMGRFKTMPELQRINLFMSRTPCYHQDCESKCEVLQSCEAQRSCARRLAVTFAKIKRRVGSVNLKMTVKFLTPYVKRGDLYTQQAILAMMHSGITVEPMVMKEWYLLLTAAEPTKTSLFASVIRSNSATLNAGELNSSIRSDVAQWSRNKMDIAHVRKSQRYVNACRKTLGLPTVYWSSPFHELLKTSAVFCDLTQRRLNEISAKLERVDNFTADSATAYSDVASSMTGSVSATVNLSQVARQKSELSTVAADWLTTDEINDSNYNNGIEILASNDTTAYGNLSPKTSPQKEQIKAAKRERRSCSVKEMSREKHHKKSEFRSLDDSDVAHLLRPPADVRRMLLNLSARPMMDDDRQIATVELSQQVNQLAKQLDQLMQFIEHKSITTTV